MLSTRVFRISKFTRAICSIRNKNLAILFIKPVNSTSFAKFSTSPENNNTADQTSQQTKSVKAYTYDYDDTDDYVEAPKSAFGKVKIYYMQKMVTHNFFSFLLLLKSII
jgi:hypothetical protein